MTRPQARCVDCDQVAPPLDEDQTLRSSLGWRLVFVKRSDGNAEQVWRCPSCWKKHKARAAGRQ